MNPFTPYIQTRQFVCVRRRGLLYLSIRGFVLAVSDRLALLHKFNNFDPDGYTILRVDDTEQIEAGQSEAHWERMLRAEGLVGGLELPVTIDLTTLHSAIESIQASFEYMILNCDDDDDLRRWDWLAGHPLSMERDRLSFRHYDKLGRWHAEPAVISFDEITSIEFDNPYLNRFTRYLDNDTPAPESEEE